MKTFSIFYTTIPNYQQYLKKTHNKNETKLNVILKIINEINEKQDKETLKSNEEYNEIIGKLKSCLNELDLIVNEINVDIDIKSIGMDVCEDDNDDESELFDKDNEFKLIKTNRYNEMESIKLKEEGNKEFIAKNTASFELNLQYADQQANGNFISDHNDFDCIKSAENFVTIAIECRPGWAKSYFRLAKIKSRLSNCQHAIQLFGAALHLESLQSSKEEIEKLKQSCLQKLKMIQDSCTTTTTSETTSIKRSRGTTIRTTITKTITTRDFERESKVRLQDLGNLVHEKFKNFKLTKNLLQKYQIHQELGFSNDRLWEMDALEYSFEQMRNGTYKGAIELLKATIGNGTDYCEAYTGYSDLFRKIFYSDCGFKFVDSNGDNRPLLVSLLLHASTLDQFIKVERLN
ncbi:hypothetical protein ACTFIY_003427 [Dictyostelium cf. discoideum]